jgi:glycine cleavage system H protein
MKHEKYRYTEDHEWISEEGGNGVIGITDYAQKQLGDIVYVDLPAVGKKIEKGKEMGSIESVKAVADVYSPVTGEVMETNQVLQDAPETMNKDPYGEGWIAKIKLEKPEEIASLMDHAGYEKYVAEESKK